MDKFKNHFDIVIINNCPSFYKINLYNKLSTTCKIHVVFIGMTNQVVINDSFRSDIKFSYELLNEVQIEKRNKLRSIIRLIRILKRYNYKRIIYGGYNDLEERLLMWFTPKSKNCLQFESSIKESKISGVVSFVKKLVFSRFAIALPSGKLQSDVFKALQYKGKIIETKGVGLFNKPDFLDVSGTRPDSELRYLYVGRLIGLKNLEQLIRIFNHSGKSLTIVGTGVLESELMKMAQMNIKFIGFVSNNEISSIYLNHDVFILPSFSEPWGLVVEEAIYFGLPVIVSENVGCHHDMVLKPNTGLVFSPDSDESLMAAIDSIEEHYFEFKNNCTKFDFKKQNQVQIDAYLKTLSI